MLSLITLRWRYFWLSWLGSILGGMLGGALLGLVL
jgi:glycerol uptake facilitator-like aquaporin